MNKIYDFTDLHISQQTRVNIPDHEVLISFNNDCGAEAFQEWWDADGFNQYKLWVERNMDYLSDRF